MDYLATFHTPGQEKKWYIVKVPEFLEPHFYRQSRSIDAFKNREAKRVYGEGGLAERGGLKSATYCSVRYDWDDSDIGLDVITEYMNRIKAEATYCNDVWDFYEKIGYDRKRKKYTR